MSKFDRFPSRTATKITQSFLDECQDNLEFSLRLISEIEVSDTFSIKTSDQHGFVGQDFYEARGKIPAVSRTIGEYLRPQVEFSSLKLSISNVDGRFDSILPGGDDYSGLTNKSLSLRVGLSDKDSSYIPIFRGSVTPVAGLSRSSKEITFIARDRFDLLNIDIPASQFTKSRFPNMEKTGDYIPVIYGSFQDIKVPLYVINDSLVKKEDNFDPVEIVLSSNDLKSVSGLVLQRDGSEYPVALTDYSFGSGLKTLFVRQGGDTLIDGEPFKFKSSDKFLCHLVGKDLGDYTDNIISQAKDILISLAGATEADFDSSWERFRDKPAPAVSAIKNIKSRVYLNKKLKAIDYVLSMFEQVRLEMFQSRSLKLSLSSLHFDDFVAEPEMRIDNFDVERGSLKITTDFKNTFTGAQGFFAPDFEGASKSTPLLRNKAAEDQLSQKIFKKIDFPNLYEEDAVTSQTEEILKLASAYREYVELTLTPRSLLVDIGDWLLVDISDSGAVFDKIPMLVRSVSFSPEFKIKIMLFSFQMIPFTGWNPGYSGIIGGENAKVIKEN